MTAVMTSAERSQSGPRELSSVAECRGWLARTGVCPWFEYHRGHLIWDRSPSSDLTEDDRRTLATVADAVFRAAEQGQVHLVQLRKGPFDFSYLAIRAARCRNRRAVPGLTIDHAAAQRSTFCSEAA
jgi:hypothetical protein